jgi:hypothetical protein
MNTPYKESNKENFKSLPQPIQLRKKFGSYVIMTRGNTILAAVLRVNFPLIKKKSCTLYTYCKNTDFIFACRLVLFLCKIASGIIIIIIIY